MTTGRKCRGCGHYLPDDAFQPGSRVCRHCQNKRSVQTRTVIRAYIAGFREASKCERCGLRGADVALEFHHGNPAEKLFAIGAFHYKTSSMDAVKKEIRKCAMLCLECHAITHEEARREGATYEPIPDPQVSLFSGWH